MIFERAKIASNTLKNIDTKTKNLALQKIADALRKNIDKILQANAIDIQVAKDNGVTNMLDRLLLTEQRVLSIASDIEKIITLTTPRNNNVYLSSCSN